MNLILGKSKQEQANVLWEPFATSTPLKVVPNNGKIIHELKLLTQIGSVNYYRNSLKDQCTSDIFQEKFSQSKDSIPKKGKKNKSYAYFDLSSSSDDDNPAESKRPIIKLNSSKKTRCLLKSKKLDSEESVNKIGEAVDNCTKHKSAEKEENATSAKMDLRTEKRHTQNGKRKTKIASIKSNSVISCVSPGEKSKIFDESKKNNLFRGTKSSSTLNNKKNDLIHLKSEQKFNEANDAKLNKKGMKKDTSKNLTKSESKVIVNNPQNETENNKVLKTLKRRSPNNIINNIPVKKSLSKNTKSKSSAQRSKSDATPFHIWEKKRNLSHQLFSDSREQEFINTLDLTSEEINEAVQIKKYSSWQKQKELPHKVVSSSRPINENKDIIPKPEEDKQERPKRRKQKPKEFWIPETESDKSLNNIKVDEKKHETKNSKISTKEGLNSEQNPVIELNDQPVLPEDIKENNPENAISLSSAKLIKRGGRRRGITQETEKQNEPNDAVVTSSNDSKSKPGEINPVIKCSRKNAPADRDLQSNKVCVENATAEEQTTTTVFKQLYNLPFKNNGMGCFASECWQTNNIKCGVLKLLVNSQLTYKTLHKNSHMGGVVVKGILKMKIGDKVLDLKEGDMAFVPPKTEWQATNIGECESIFYYWCGRFNC